MSEHSNARAVRFSGSLSRTQDENLRSIIKETGLTRTEIIRNAVVLFTMAYKGRQKGQRVCLVNEDDVIQVEIASTI